MQYNQSVSCLKQLTRVSHAACVPRVILHLRFNQHLAQAQEKTCNYALPGLAQKDHSTAVFMFQWFKFPAHPHRLFEFVLFIRVFYSAERASKTIRKTFAVLR